MEVLQASRNATIDFLARGATFGGGCPIGANRSTRRQCFQSQVLHTSTVTSSAPVAMYRDQLIGTLDVAAPPAKRAKPPGADAPHCWGGNHGSSHVTSLETL